MKRVSVVGYRGESEPLVSLPPSFRPEVFDVDQEVVEPVRVIKQATERLCAYVAQHGGITPVEARIRTVAAKLLALTRRN